MAKTLLKDVPLTEDVPIKIRANDVGFGYGHQDILQNIHFTVREGEFVVLMGPSGCGKSTFLRLVSGLSLPTRGKLEIDGEPVRDTSIERAIVFQDYSLFPWLTTGENVMLALSQVMKKKKKEIQQVAQEYLQMVQLEHAFDKYPGQLSGGMRQRAAIARALALSADLLLMDEPFGALDPVTRVHLQDLILQLWQDRRQTVLFVTHDVEEALFLADRILLFSPGPLSMVAHELKIPFARPRQRKKVFQSPEFTELRDQLMDHMNKGLFEKLEREETVFYPGDRI